MNICVIAAEYNPFHLGHEYHIAKTREKLGKDTLVVAVMSGSFVQRGDFAVMDKYKRALCAVKGGADLVLELPVPFCLCSAEMFAESVVYIAGKLGAATHMSFGCENDNAGLLTDIAKVFSNHKIHKQISKEVKNGYSYAAARKKIAGEIFGENAAALDCPNNILAVEYLKALMKHRTDIEPVFIKRMGSGHDCDICGVSEKRGGFYKQNSEGTAASASFIRGMLKKGDINAAKKYLPAGTADILEEQIKNGCAPVCMENAMRAVLARLRCLREMDIASLPDAGAGLSHRIFRAIRDGADFYEIANAAKTKVYPESRIRRILMRAYLGITSDMTEQMPLFTSVLSCNARGRAFLRGIGGESGIPIITRPAESKKYPVPIRESFDFYIRADDMFALGYPEIDGIRGGSGFRRMPELE